MGQFAKAIRIRGAGGVEVLHLEDVERPVVVGAHDILVEVAAAGLNRADCLQRRGFYPAPKGTVADIPGLEYSGVVCEVGTGTRWKLGDHVMGICAGGAMSTHLAVHEDTAVAVPNKMDLVEAAAIPEVYFTAYDALVQGGWENAKHVVIHAIGSGVGTAALQLAKRAGLNVIGTSRTQDKLDKAEHLGLDTPVLVNDGTFAKAVRDASDGGCDIILDFVGAAYLKENIKALASQGRLVIIGLLGGVTGEMPLGLLLAKRATVIGTVLRSRNLQEKAALSASFTESVLPGFESGQLTPVIDRIMPMTEIAAAHEYMESNASFGTIVMRW